MIARVAFLILAACLVASSAQAQSSEDGEGRRRWKQGQEYYQKGRYLDAAREFEAGYAAAPRPLFLLNIGHAYRRAQELVKAKAAYEKLLQLQPDLPQRAEVEGYVKSIDDALQVVEPFAAEPVAPAPPTAPPTPASALPDPLTAAQTAVAPAPSGTSAPAAAVSEQAPTPVAAPSRSLFTRPWFWVIVGAAVAGGVAAGVIALRPTTSCPGTLCIKE